MIRSTAYVLRIAPLRRVAAFWLAAFCLTLACWCVAASTAWGQAGVNRSVPSTGYYLAVSELAVGEYASAMRGIQNESRSAIKTPQSSWIDSICYRAMLGECYYHMGKYPQALEQYNGALQLYSTFSEWMLRVQFPGNLQPDNSKPNRQIPWGRSTRNFRLARVPETFTIQQGRINNNDVVQQGGVVQQAVLYPINVVEIVQCTSLAIRRRRELMGPVCKHDPLTNEVLTRLIRRPGPQDWSEGWIDLQLGLAYAAADQIPQAQQLLQRAIVLGGEWDHPLTCVALLEIGRLAMEAGDFQNAARYLEEATYSAVYYDNALVLEEAFRLGQRNHLMSNAKGVYPPLERVVKWAKTNRYRHLQIWATALLAENYLTLGQTQLAASALNDARSNMGRRDMAAAVVGAYINYLTAIVSFQSNQPKVGQEALAATLAFQATGSKWLYQIALADSLFVGGTLSSRDAVALYKQLLRDPLPSDWASVPLESLSVLSIPHYPAFEHWFNASLDRKEVEGALEVADRARRHRFLSSLPLGGRLLALRTILETPPEELGREAVVQRQDLLVRYPKYDELAQQSRAMRTALLEQPLAHSDSAANRAQGDAIADWGKVSQAQEAILIEMALRREPAEISFPPLHSLKDLQKSLPSGTLVWVFFSSGARLHSYLISSERYAHWDIAAGAPLDKNLVKMLRDLGNYDQNRELPANELTSTQWKTAASAMLEQLLKDSKVDLAKGIKELVIVPDGELWYLPFEALPVGPDRTPLVTHCNVRYVPTLGLAMPQPRPRRQLNKMGVVVGKLMARDDAAVAREAFSQIQQTLPEAVALPAPLPGSSAVYGALLDRLIVLDDMAVDPAQPYGWAPIALDKNKGTGALTEWFALPWGGPTQIIMPGFHTAAENGLKQSKGAVLRGHEVFLAVTGMMSGGAQTILLSRWRTGGQTSFDLVREFAQELPHARAVDAWRRSIELAMETPLNAELETRVGRFDADNPPAAIHPFFWAGYMLVDTGGGPKRDDDPVVEKKPVVEFKKPVPKPPPVEDPKAEPKEKDPVAGKEAPRKKQPAGDGPFKEPPADEPAVADGDGAVPEADAAPEEPAAVPALPKKKSPTTRPTPKKKSPTKKAA